MKWLWDSIDPEYTLVEPNIIQPVTSGIAIAFHLKNAGFAAEP